MALDDDTLLATALGDDEVETYVFGAPPNDHWVRKADMPYGRYNLVCGVVNNGTEGLKVVAVGGQYREEVFIYSVDDDEWRQGGNCWRS